MERLDFVISEVKQLHIPVVMNWLPLVKENYPFYNKLILQKNCEIKYDNGKVQNYQDKELPYQRVTHFRPIKATYA